MTLEQEQKDLETSSVSRGVLRYYKALEVAKANGRHLDQSPANGLMNSMVHALVPHVIQHQRLAREKLVSAQTSGRRLGGWELPFALSDATAISYIALRTIVSGVATGRTKHGFGRTIGRIACLELRWEELRAAEKGRAKAEATPNRLAYLKKSVKSINPRSVAKWLKRLDDCATTEWTNETMMKMGCELLGLVDLHCSDYITVTRVKKQVKQRVQTLLEITLTEQVTKSLSEGHGRASLDAPWLAPMICPPAKWRWDGEEYVGGYLTIPQSIIRRSWYGDDHTAVLYKDGGIPEVTLAALNTIGSTPWRINEPVRKLAEWAVKTGQREISPVEPTRELPPKIQPEEWAAMDGAERTVHKATMRQVYDINLKLANSRDEINRTLQVAEDFKDSVAIYFPHSLDFRGRCYPMPQDLNPQGRDIGRGLLTFASALPLGKVGVRWLTYHVAATYGNDKLTRDEQILWVHENIDEIAAVARDPKGSGYEFWSKASEPWQFIAAALELEAAFNHPDGPEAFASSLNVSIDGSCNGLQHLSAMGLDPVGGAAVNLTNNKERSDIYQIVADRVREGLDQKKWPRPVDRKLVKRGVMTTPYGVTPIGIRDQLIGDKFTNVVDEANYMRDEMIMAIDETIIKGREIMDWMVDSAKVAAHHGEGVQWTAPSGFQCLQKYTVPTQVRITTLLGTTVLSTMKPEGTVDTRKQASAIAPNMIHSADAGHMCLTIAAGVKEGVHSYGVVHDSYGCHAANMDKLSAVVRSEFVKIYQENWFDRWVADLQRTVGDNPVLAPPERGDLDINEVLDSPFFFS